ncbi:MAG: site-specific integrase [Armatimonadota bacterium]
MRGSVTERPKGSGRFRIQWYVGKSPEGKPIYHNKTIRGEKRDAEAELNRILYDLHTGDYVQPAQITFGEYLGQWMRRRRASAKMKAQEETLCRCHIIPGLGHVKLNKLKTVQIDNFITKLQESKSRLDGTAPLSDQTIWHIAKTIRKALNDAVTWQSIRTSPFSGIKMPKYGGSNIEFFTKPALAKILTAAKEHRYHIPILIAATSGLRIGEVMALTWNAIDFVGNTISVYQAVQSHSWHMEIGDVKTYWGKRAVPVDKSVISILKAHKQNIEELAKKQADVWQEHGWVSPDNTGELINIESVRKAFPKICKKAGVKIAGIHSLRHTYATIMLSEGVPIHIVSRRLGHSSIKITSDTYGHIMPETLNQSVNVFRDML